MKLNCLALAMLATALPMLFSGCSLTTEATDDEEPRIIVQKIVENVYVLLGGKGLGANVGVVVGKEGIVLIDSMNASSNLQLQEAVRSISDKPIQFVINTHHHSDHTGGNDALAAEGVIRIAHDNTRYTASAYDVGVQAGYTHLIGDEEVVVHHVVGHTYNDILVYLATSNVLFMGDTFTNIWHPTANIRGLTSERDVINMALSITDESTVIVPGHGYLDTHTGLHRYKTRTDNWYVRIAELIENGMTAKQMSTDIELNNIRQAFVESREPPIMADDRFMRFIERTLSAQFVTEFSIETHALHTFTGQYATDDGRVLEIFVDDDSLYSNMLNGFYENLIAVSSSEFHVRHSLGTTYTFSRAAPDGVLSLRRRSGDEAIVAVRITTVD